MKNTIVLLLLATVLVGGAGLWWSHSRNPEQGALQPGSLASAPSASTRHEEPQLEAAPGEQRGTIPAPVTVKNAPAPAPIAAQGAVPPSVLVDPTQPAGTLPSEVETDPDPFALIWADAKLPELKAAYKAKNELYEMNRDGHVTDKLQVVTGEDLERLKREVAWLKEKAFGGG
jgi:hypothetical protein